MKKSEIIGWDFAFLITLILFLSTQNPGNYHLIIGFDAILIFIYSIKSPVDYYKIKGRTY